MNKLFWRTIAIVDVAILIWIAPFGWAMADGRWILQGLVIATYAVLAVYMVMIVRYAFTQVR